MLFIPYSTDAPVYYWPIATVGLIVANVAAFAIVAAGGELSPEGWMLSFGNGLHPEQWLLSIFMHAGPGHLIGNMIFLWLFGLVVEGKLGWWRFLCCYLAIGIGQMAIEQVAMLGYQGDIPGAVGASGAIFGLMAMAVMWAPMNEITYFYWVAFYVGTFDISIAMMAGLYAGYELLMICLSGGAVGSSWLHLTGFVLGLLFGFILLKRKMVDCEGWDAISVWSGNYGGFREEPDPREELKKIVTENKQRDEHLISGAQQQFQHYVKTGNVEAAIRFYEKMKNVAGGITPKRGDWLAMINWFHKHKRWTESVPYLAKYIAAYPDQADAARIKLAQICVVEMQRPGKSLDLLDEVNMSKLPAEQVNLVRRIQAKAKQLQLEGVVELDLDTW